MAKLALTENDKAAMRAIAEDYLGNYGTKHHGNGRLALFAKILEEVRPDIASAASKLGREVQQQWEGDTFREGPNPYAEGYASVANDVDGLRELWGEFQDRNDEVVRAFEREGTAILPTHMPRL